MILSREEEVEELVREVRELAAVHGANTLRMMIAAFAAHAIPNAIPLDRVLHGTGIHDDGLTEVELRMAAKRGIAVDKLAETKRAAIAAGTYPGS